VGHEAQKKDVKYAKSLIGCPKGKKKLGRPRRNGETILKWIPKKMSGMMETAFIRNITGSGGGLL
jgi:hypothetical protein